VLAVSLALISTADADRVSSLIGRLRSSKDYKVRLSSALALAKSSDKRTIPAFVGALGDRDKTVRGVAAASLAKVVTSRTPLPLRKKALEALNRARTKDKNAFVRSQATKAFESLSRLGAPIPKADVYVHVSDMAEEAGQPQVKKLMRTTALTSLKQHGGKMALEWPGGAPRQDDLGAMPAFHLHGTVNELSSRKRGGRTTVTCKINMVLATYPDKKMFGFLRGGASVEASTSPRDIRLAKEDCVAAVVEDLVVTKIVPTIRQRVK